MHVYALIVITNTHMPIARILNMAEHKASFQPLISVRASITGRPKKFCWPWSSVMKRVYIMAETCAKLRQVKKAKGFTSDECTLRYLLNCYEGISAIITEDPAVTPPPASSSSLFYAAVEAPVMCNGIFVFGIIVTTLTTTPVFIVSGSLQMVRHFT